MAIALQYLDLLELVARLDLLLLSVLEGSTPLVLPLLPTKLVYLLNKNAFWCAIIKEVYHCILQGFNGFTSINSNTDSSVLKILKILLVFVLKSCSILNNILKLVLLCKSFVHFLTCVAWWSVVEGIRLLTEQQLKCFKVKSKDFKNKNQINIKFKENL